MKPKRKPRRKASPACTLLREWARGLYYPALESFSRSRGLRKRARAVRSAK